MLRDGYIVLNTRKGKLGQTIHELKGQPESAYTAIRGGLSWPTPSSSAYYCLFGEVYERHRDYRNREIRGALMLLAEAEANTLDSLFDSLTGDALLLGCRTIYTDADRENYIEYFRDRMHDKEIYVSLDAAPFGGEFQVGVGIIEGWRRAGAFASDAIPSDSILSDQLGRITDEDLGDSPEMRFHAINAFRYVVGGFEKNRWRPASGRSRGRRRDGRVV
jgi:hypothetical protein